MKIKIDSKLLKDFKEYLVYDKLFGKYAVFNQVF